MNSDRPHDKIWPKRLPRELQVPRTTLGSNLDVAALRYPDKAAFIFFGRALRYAELKAQAEALAGWLQSVGVKKGDRVALYMQNCPQFVVAVYGILRADAVVVPVNPMNRAEEFSHYITDPQTKAVVCSADLAGFVDAANRALPAAQRVAQVLVTHYADAMPDGELDAAEAPNDDVETMAAGAACAARRLHRLDRRAGGGPCARPCDGTARRPGAAALHLGHDRAAEGLHAHPCHLDAQRGVGQLEPQRTGDDRAGRGADVPHHRHAGVRARRGAFGGDDRADATLGPRTGRAADLPLPRHATGRRFRRWSSTCSAAPTTRAST